MKISIITASFNAEKTVEKCIRSVMEQRNAEFEHLLIDNVSTDRTVEIAKGIDPELRVFSEPDQGIYDAMNKGAARASGEILAWLNADDAYLPGTLEKAANHFESHPETDFLHGNICVNGKCVKPPSGIASFGGFRIFHPATFIRRSAFQKYGPFKTDYRICADLDLFLTAGAGGAVFAHQDDIFTDFALEGLSTKRRKETAEEVKKILLAHGYGFSFAYTWYCCMCIRALAANLIRVISPQVEKEGSRSK